MGFAKRSKKKAWPWSALVEIAKKKPIKGNAYLRHKAELAELLRKIVGTKKLNKKQDFSVLIYFSIKGNQESYLKTKDLFLPGFLKSGRDLWWQNRSRKKAVSF